HLLRQQLRGQAQPNVRHFLADLGEHGVTVLLELAAKCVDVVLVDLIPRAFRAAGIMRISALALLPGRPQICELFGCLRHFGTRLGSNLSLLIRLFRYITLGEGLRASLVYLHASGLLIDLATTTGNLGQGGAVGLFNSPTDQASSLGPPRLLGSPSRVKICDQPHWR